MADILIKGLALPKNYPYRLSIEADGTVTEHTIGAKATAIELRSHGRLVDGDRLIDILEEAICKLDDKEMQYMAIAYQRIVDVLNHIEPFVEASNGSDN